jgi:hypothetical protein
MPSQRPLAPGAVEPTLLEVDGVLRTAGPEAQAWKRLFDAYLLVRAHGLDEPFQPFDPVADHRRFVDGNPPYEGVGSFLASRGIKLPFGSPDDPTDRETICGLANCIALLDQGRKEGRWKTGRPSPDCALLSLRCRGARPRPRFQRCLPDPRGAGCGTCPAPSFPSRR